VEKCGIAMGKESDFSSFTVHDLPKPERPRERLGKYGAEALSAQELLALVIGRGIPKKLIHGFGCFSKIEIWPKPDTTKGCRHRSDWNNSKRFGWY